ncbi:hypothetical protein IK146_03540 [Candidatus Saccharibacteria bacterium]|nr:hypothetical protein [Candidatus Saccharibacteria bacterium]
MVSYIFYPITSTVFAVMRKESESQKFVSHALGDCYESIAVDAFVILKKDESAQNGYKVRHELTRKHVWHGGDMDKIVNAIIDYVKTKGTSKEQFSTWGYFDV